MNKIANIGCSCPRGGGGAAKSEPKRAFTLAEVLITLGIIGIVAAMTMPSVISKYQKKETVVKLRKVYSEINNAVRMSEAENGEMSSWVFPQQPSNSNFAVVKPFIEKYYLPYFNGAKLYDKNDFVKSYKMHSLIDREILILSNYLVLKDGTILSFFTNIPVGYIWLFADINGIKGPNTAGKDIFVFDAYKYLKNQYKISFWGESFEHYTDRRDRLLIYRDAYGCNKIDRTSRYNGFYCGALIMYDNWEIKDDYPW